MRISDWSSDVCSSDLCKSLWRRQGQLRQLTRLNAHGALLRQSVQFPDICQALSLLPGNPLGRQTMRSGNILEWPFIIGDIVKKEPCLHCGMKGVRVQGRLWIIGPFFSMRQNDLNIKIGRASCRESVWQ